MWKLNDLVWTSYESQRKAGECVSSTPIVNYGGKAAEGSQSLVRHRVCRRAGMDTA